MSTDMIQRIVKERVKEVEKKSVEAAEIFKHYYLSKFDFRGVEHTIIGIQYMTEDYCEMYRILSDRIVFGELKLMFVCVAGMNDVKYFRAEEVTRIRGLRYENQR